MFTSKKLIGQSSIFEDEVDALHILDEQLFKISKKLNLSRIMKPTNYLEELDVFVTQHGAYNPKFIYKWPSRQRLDKILTEIRQIEQEYFGDMPVFKSPFAQLFFDKIQELIRKHAYVLAYSKQNYSAIHDANIAMYGTLDKAMVTRSREIIFDHKNPTGLL